MCNKCQCEHIAHLDRDARPPDGNLGHKYGAGCLKLRRVQTIYGTFAVCADCFRDCYANGASHYIVATAA